MNTHDAKLDWGVACEAALLACPGNDVWATLNDVSGFAARCLDVLELQGWCFCWDRAVRRLGCCSFAKRRISLSRYFAEMYLVKSPELVWRTLMHELAHALAMSRYRQSGHGRVWQYYCGLLGIPGERASCRCDDFTPEHFKQRRVRYVLCHRESGEIFRYYKGKPRTSLRRLKQMYIVGRREDTLGKLMICPVNDEA